MMDKNSTIIFNTGSSTTQADMTWHVKDRQQICKCICKNVYFSDYREASRGGLVAHCCLWCQCTNLPVGCTWSAAADCASSCRWWRRSWLWPNGRQKCLCKVAPPQIACSATQGMGKLGEAKFFSSAANCWLATTYWLAFVFVHGRFCFPDLLAVCKSKGREKWFTVWMDIYYTWNYSKYSYSY